MKFVDTLFGLLLPEFYILLGFYQLIEARSCRKRVRSLSRQEFTLREAFFITMGGYRVVIPQAYLQAGDSEPDEQTFVLRSAHVLWLLDTGVLALPAKNHSDIGILSSTSAGFREEVKEAMKLYSDVERGSASKTPLSIAETTELAERGSARHTPLPTAEIIEPAEHGLDRNTPSQTAEIIEPVESGSACNTPLPTAEIVEPPEHGSARNTPLPTTEAIESGDLNDSEESDGGVLACLADSLGYFVGICFFAPCAFCYTIWTAVKSARETKDDSEAISTTNTRGPPQALLTSPEIIKDRSHSDSVAKFIIVLQCIWFLVNCIGRGAHYLPLSLLEVATLAYIVFTLGAYALWWEKPQGVQETTVFTPQLEDSQWKALAALNSTNVMMQYFQGAEAKTDKWLPGLSGWEHWHEDIYYDRYKRSVWLVFCLACWSSAGLHCIAWNAEFPSVAEQNAWRVFVVLLFVTPLPTVADSRFFFCSRGHFTTLWFRWRLQAIGVSIAVASKLGILILALISFRAAPASIYDTWVSVPAPSYTRREISHGFEIEYLLISCQEIANWLLFWL